jgi:hypothetical protein
MADKPTLYQPFQPPRLRLLPPKRTQRIDRLPGSEQRLGQSALPQG